jgi:hypothetical protein
VSFLRTLRYIVPIEQRETGLMLIGSDPGAALHIERIHSLHSIERLNLWGRGAARLPLVAIHRKRVAMVTREESDSAHVILEF